LLDIEMQGIFLDYGFTVEYFERENLQSAGPFM